MADRKPQIAFRGAANLAPFGSLPAGFAPFAAIRDVRVYGAQTKTPRGSRRQVLRKLIAQQLNDAPVQAVLAVSRASALVGYTRSGCRPMGPALSNPSAPLVGQIAALDDVPSMDWFVNLDVTPAGGPADADVQCCNWDPDGQFLDLSSNYKIGSDACFSVARIDPATGATLWRTDRHDSGKNVSVNNICVTKLYTFVALAHNATGGPYLLAYRNDTGAMASGIAGESLFGWGREAVAMCRTVDANGQENLFVAFLGSAVAGTYLGGLGSGTIQFGRYAQDFRGGIMKFHIVSAAYGSTTSTRVAWGNQLGPTDDYFDNTISNTNPHDYWRGSEHNPARPHGMEFTALRSGPDGSIYFAKRNQGWGPNNAHALFKPDGRSEQYATVGKINAAGDLLWLQDTGRIPTEVDDLGFANDLTFPGDPSPDPMIQALCVNQTTGDWYAAGRQTSTGVSVFAGDGTSGTPRWSANLQNATGSIREGAASIGIDGNPWFGGDRNASWDGATSRSAHLWRLNKTDGSVLTFFDLGRPGIGALSVAASGLGDTFYTTQKVD